MASETPIETEKNPPPQTAGVKPELEEGDRQAGREKTAGDQGEPSRVVLVQNLALADRPIEQQGDRTGAAPHVDQPDNRFDLNYTNRGGLSRYLGTPGDTVEKTAVYKCQVSENATLGAGKHADVPLPPGSFMGPTVPESFKNKVTDWWQHLPENVRKMALESHLKVMVVTKAGDVPGIDPHQLARRHLGEQNSNLPAFYDQHLGAIVLVQNPDKTEAQKAQAAVQKAKGVYSNVTGGELNFGEHATHELGHGLDYKHFNTSEPISHSKEFDDAFKQSQAAVRKLRLSDYRYYTEADPQRYGTAAYNSTKEEMLAQLFALIQEQKAGQKLSAGDENFVKACQPFVKVMRDKHLV